MLKNQNKKRGRIDKYGSLMNGGFLESSHGQILAEVSVVEKSKHEWAKWPLRVLPGPG